MIKNVKFDAGVRRSLDDRLKALVANIEAQSEAILSIHDLGSILRGVEIEALLQEKRYHWHPYCVLGRKRGNEFDHNCIAHCRDQVDQDASNLNHPFLTLCWKGVQEIIVPIKHEGKLVMIFFLGVFRHPNFKNKPGKKFSNSVCAAYEKLPIIDEKKSVLYSEMLLKLGQGIIMEVEAARRSVDEGDSRKSQIRHFIIRHADKKIGLPELAKDLHLSPSRARHVVQELFGKSFQDLLVEERISRARNLLTTSQRTIEDIAQSCGFNNAYYFSRSFKKWVGKPPGKYRKEEALPYFH